MELEAIPTLSEHGLALVGRALASARAGFAATNSGYDSAWRRAAAREAVDRQPAVVRYAPSPRSTRGATRA